MNIAFDLLVFIPHLVLSNYLHSSASFPAASVVTPMQIPPGNVSGDVVITDSPYTMLQYTPSDEYM